MRLSYIFIIFLNMGQPFHIVLIFYFEIIGQQYLSLFCISLKLCYSTSYLSNSFSNVIYLIVYRELELCAFSDNPLIEILILPEKYKK
jgi:hypothetical protein